MLLSISPVPPFPLVGHPIGTKLVIEAGPADLQELSSLCTIVSGLLESLKNPDTFGLTDGPARNSTEIVPRLISSHRHNVHAIELRTGGGHDFPFEIMLQFPHVARP